MCVNSCFASGILGTGNSGSELGPKTNTQSTLLIAYLGCNLLQTQFKPEFQQFEDSLESRWAQEVHEDFGRS